MSDAWGYSAIHTPQPIVLTCVCTIVPSPPLRRHVCSSGSGGGGGRVFSSDRWSSNDTCIRHRESRNKCSGCPRDRYSRDSRRERTSDFTSRKKIRRVELANELRDKNTRANCYNRLRGSNRVHDYIISLLVCNYDRIHWEKEMATLIWIIDIFGPRDGVPRGIEWMIERGAAAYFSSFWSQRFSFLLEVLSSIHINLTSGDSFFQCVSDGSLQLILSTNNN